MSLDQTNCEERLRIWLGTCPGFQQDHSRDRLIHKMLTAARIPLDWGDFESALKRCGYEIGFSSGTYVCPLPEMPRG